MYETRQHKEATSRVIQKPEGKRGQMFRFKDDRKKYGLHKRILQNKKKHNLLSKHINAIQLVSANISYMENDTVKSVTGQSGNNNETQQLINEAIPSFAENVKPQYRIITINKAPEEMSAGWNFVESNGVQYRYKSKRQYSPYQCAEPNALARYIAELKVKPFDIKLSPNPYFYEWALDDTNHFKKPCEVCSQWITSGKRNGRMDIKKFVIDDLGIYSNALKMHSPIIIEGDGDLSRGKLIDINGLTKKLAEEKLQEKENIEKKRSERKTRQKYIPILSL